MADMTCQDALAWGRSQLNDAHSATETGALDCEILLAHILQSTRAMLWREPKHIVSANDFAQFQEAIAKRRLGVPVVYLTGDCEFWSLPLRINESVLVPRPETEHVIECALAQFPDPTQSLHCLELGTGSGAIAVALAHERPRWSIVAGEASPAAMQVARANAERLGVASIQFVLSDWYQALPSPESSQPFQLIISNPPYLAENDPHFSSGLRYEPRQALAAGSDGYAAFVAIIQGARPYLAANGCIILEHGLGQAPTLAKLLNKNGFTVIAQVADLQGILRVIVAKMV